MRRLPFGFYNVKDPRTIPHDTFTFILPEQPQYQSWDAGKMGGRPFVLLLAPIQEHMDGGRDGIRAQLESARTWCQARGLTPTAVGYSEEWYTHTMYDHYKVFGGRTGRLLKDWKCQVVDEILKEMKRVWPWAYTLQVENWFNDSKLLGDQFYHPCYKADILGIDAYFDPTGFQSPYGPLSSESLHPKFAFEVGQIFHHAATYKRPLLMIGQGFTWRGSTPTAWQLRWYFELAQSIPEVLGLAYYARESTHDGLKALDKHPELLKEVQWQYEQCGGMGRI